MKTSVIFFIALLINIPITIAMEQKPQEQYLTVEQKKAEKQEAQRYFNELLLLDKAKKKALNIPQENLPPYDDSSDSHDKLIYS
jgi:hypothetical protein